MPSPSRRSEVAPFVVMDVMRAAAEAEAAGHKIHHLEVGQPCTPAPIAAREAAMRAIVEDPLGYTGALGLDALRERIARHHAQWYGQAIAPERIAVTSGTSAGFMLACLAAFDPGARVAVTTPGYPCHRNTLLALGLRPVPLRVGPQTGYKPTPAALAALGPVEGLVVASPANPTGTVLDAAEMQALAEHCERTGVRIVSDEIYQGLVYDGRNGRAVGRDVSMASHSPDAIVINGFSKYFSMTGWRLGWMVLPPPLVRRVERLTQNLLIAASTLSQHAGLAALDCGAELDLHTRRYADNRATVLEGLAAAGITEVAPADGAFYVYAEVGHLGSDSVQLCRDALREAGVAITPGVDFDPERGRTTIRLSYARSRWEVARGTERLVEWLVGRSRRRGGERRWTR